jgi:hypothetical protein
MGTWLARAGSHPDTLSFGFHQMRQQEEVVNKQTSNKPKDTKKLTLNKETLRQLNDAQSGAVVGGAVRDTRPVGICTCDTCEATD